MEQIREPVVHGALDYEELERLGLHPDDIYDFSVNSNPYGPSPRVREALNEVPIERYPDRACLALRRTIQTYELNETQLPLDAILCGNGTAELIGAIARAFLQPGTKAALLGPTFGEYRAVSLAVGASVVTYTAQAAEQFYPDMDAVAVWLEHEQPALLWLCNPNNPTGIWLDRRTITLLSDICQRIGTLLVIDEAYWHFLVPQEASPDCLAFADQRFRAGGCTSGLCCCYSCFVSPCVSSSVLMECERICTGCWLCCCQ